MPCMCIMHACVRSRDRPCTCAATAPCPNRTSLYSRLQQQRASLSPGQPSPTQPGILPPPHTLGTCSNDPAAKGAPSGFAFNVREVRVAAGAGWLIAVCGDMMMIPGLPTRPAFYEIDIDPDTGRVLGLS